VVSFAYHSRPDGVKPAASSIFLAAARWARPARKSAGFIVSGGCGLAPSSIRTTTMVAARDLTSDGRYARVGGVKAGQTVTLTFPIPERTARVIVEKRPYTLIRRGNDVVYIDSSGKNCPLYHRGHYCQGETLWKNVRRFVPAQEIPWCCDTAKGDRFMKIEGVQTHLTDAKAKPPFSFVHDGRSSAALLVEWPKTAKSQPLDKTRTQHVLRWTDPATGLEVRCVAVEPRPSNHLSSAPIRRISGICRSRRTRPCRCASLRGCSIPCKSRKSKYRFPPFYRVHHQRYAVYWKCWVCKE
jgi:hypothetical protein